MELGLCPQIELAAKEAWASWALYGILSRMTPELIETWDAWITTHHSEKWISEQKKARKQMLMDKAVVLPHVWAAEQKKAKRKSPSRTAKDASLELMHDIGGDLIDGSVFDQETMVLHSGSDLK